LGHVVAANRPSVSKKVDRVFYRAKPSTTAVPSGLRSFSPPC
jgi:hypothetical protein